MNRVLTHRLLNNPAPGLAALFSLLAFGHARGADEPHNVSPSASLQGQPGAQASSSPAAPPSATTTASVPNELFVKIKSRTFESRREPNATMTWVVQKTIYEDDSAVTTLAGVQFEEAFGLSVVLIDDVAPKDSAAPLSRPQSPAPTPSKKLEDVTSLNDNLVTDEPAQLQLQMRSLLVDLNDLRNSAATRATVPSCENGRRRAVVFLRPEQLKRQLMLNPEDSTLWSRFGRAACVRWNKFPSESAQLSKSPFQTDAPFLPNVPSPQN